MQYTKITLYKRDINRTDCFGDDLSSVIVNSHVNDASFKDLLGSLNLDLLLGSAKESIQNNFIIVLEIHVADAETASIPGVSFGEYAIDFFAKYHITLLSLIDVKSSLEKNELNGEVYYSIFSTTQTVDYLKISSISGLEPTMIYKKGEFGVYTIVGFNAWEYKLPYMGLELKDTIVKLMETIHNPSLLGNYCSENNLDSNIELTCYSVSNTPFIIPFPSGFFSFCKDLKLRAIIMDIII